MFIFKHPFITYRPDEGGSGGAVQPDEGQGPDAGEAAAVQPDEGQGQGGTSSLYEEALSSVPEEHRQYVESHFKEWDRKVNEKLEAAATYRKQWEPFEQLGIHEKFDEEQMKALVEVADALRDPDSARELVKQLAQELEVDLGAAPEGDGEQPPAGDGAGDDDPIAALRREVEELREFKQSLDLESAQAEAFAALQQEFAEIRELHGRDFTEAEEERLASLAEKLAPTSDTPLKDAYTFISEIAGDAEVGVVAGKANEPSPAASRGRASTAPPPIESFEDAERLLSERMSTSV